MNGFLYVFSIYFLCGEHTHTEIKRRMYEPTTHPFPLYHSVSHPPTGKCFFSLLSPHSPHQKLISRPQHPTTCECMLNGIDNVNRWNSNSTHMMWILCDFYYRSSCPFYHLLLDTHINVLIAVHGYNHNMLVYVCGYVNIFAVNSFGYLCR